MYGNMTSKKEINFHTFAFTVNVAYNTDEEVVRMVKKKYKVITISVFAAYTYKNLSDNGQHRVYLIFKFSKCKTHHNVNDSHNVAGLFLLLMRMNCVFNPL